MKAGGLSGRAKTLGRWSIAHLFVRAEEYLLDYIFWPFMLFRGGPWIAEAVAVQSGTTATAAAGYWTGFAVLFVMAVAVNLAYLRFNDTAKADWFGFGALRAWEQKLGALAVYRFVRMPLRVAVFIVLAVWTSPFFATLWLRSRTASARMTRSDWVIFAIAIVTAAFGWTAVVSAAAVLYGQIVRSLF